MSIVLDEYAWACDMIDSNSIGDKPSETLMRVAKKYRKDGKSKREIVGLLESFMLRCDPNNNINNWGRMIERVAKNVDKYQSIDINKIYISTAELSVIAGLSGRQMKRLAFTLLCLSKYWDRVRNTNDHWVMTPDSDIIKMANIKATIRKQSLMFGELKKMKLIEFSRRIDNLNVKVMFSYGGDDALEITDFRNLGFQYMRVLGEPYFECENCGLVTKTPSGSGRKPKYCPNCAIEVRTRQNVNSVMRLRNTY